MSTYNVIHMTSLTFGSINELNCFAKQLCSNSACLRFDKGMNNNEGSNQLRSLYIQLM